MSYGEQHEQFNLEQRLIQLNLTPAQREHALGAMKAATDAVDVFYAFTGAIKRLAAAISLKRSVGA